MAKLKLTDTNVKANVVTIDGEKIALPPAKGEVELWDSFLPGLCLRIGYGGKRTYSVSVRINRRLVRRKIGTTVTHTLAEARERAREIMIAAQKGEDPLGKVARHRARLEQALADQMTFQATAEAWLSDTGKGGGAKLRSKESVKRCLENDVYPVFGPLPIADITKPDIRNLVVSVSRRAPYMGNRVLSNIHTICKWAVRNDRIAVNPAAGIDRPSEENARDRFLSVDEIRWAWGAFSKMEAAGYSQGTVCKLLLLTGCRYMEIAALSWPEITDNVIHLSGERTKNKLPHMIPLNSMAREIIDSVTATAGTELLFPSRNMTPIYCKSPEKAKIDAMLGQTMAEELDEAFDIEKHAIPQWTTHDLRRTFVTHMNEHLKIEPHVVEAMVNHKSGGARAGVAGVYNRAQYWNQRENALEAWSNYLTGIIAGTRKSNVFQMRA